MNWTGVDASDGNSRPRGAVEPPAYAVDIGFERQGMRRRPEVLYLNDAIVAPPVLRVRRVTRSRQDAG
ncbi:hypothetical protein, partial [Caballeronia glathei]|uniref:hypothetical protein n=1 Tax=Caballeronia glathei TaxID=60547 RepID=UPI0019D32A9B